MPDSESAPDQRRQPSEKWLADIQRETGGDEFPTGPPRLVGPRPAAISSAIEEDPLPTLRRVAQEENSGSDNLLQYLFGQIFLYCWLWFSALHGAEGFPIQNISLSSLCLIAILVALAIFSFIQLKRFKAQKVNHIAGYCLTILLDPAADLLGFLKQLTVPVGWPWGNLRSDSARKHAWYCAITTTSLTGRRDITGR
ncbi:hypothetical protein JW859_10320 [bacterium]|nr:hypothetical protein [bacterium]